jgi:hypothetical protein
MLRYLSWSIGQTANIEVLLTVESTSVAGEWRQESETSLTCVFAVQGMFETAL